MINNMVGFKFKKISYNKLMLEYELRHYADLLLKSLQKIDDLDKNQQLEYINIIFNKAIKQSFTKKQLRKMEYLHHKFNFLPYKESPRNTETTHISTSYDSIHSIAYKFISLSIGAYNKLGLLLDIKNIRDNEGNILKYEVSPDNSYYCLSDGEYNAALHEDVAITTRNHIQIFIQELREYGRILSVDEVSIYAAMEEMLSIVEYPDDFEDETDEESSTKTSEIEDSSQANNAVSNAELGKQRSSSIASDRLEEIDKASDQTTYFFPDKIERNNNSEDLAMDELISWIYLLPEDIKQYFLNTNPVQSIISSLKEIENMINLPNIVSKFSLLLEISPEELHNTIWKHNNEAPIVSEVSIQEQVNDLSLLDRSMIFEGDISYMMMILPIIGLYSGLETNFNAIDYTKEIIGAEFHLFAN